MINILIVDDYGVVLVVLRQILEKADDMHIVAAATNGQEAVNEAVALCPNVAVMDVSMPTLDGIEATKQIHLKCPEINVLMVSTYNTPPYIRRSLEAGASGYILKDVISRDLITAVRTVSQGNRYFSKEVADLAKIYVQSNLHV
jgi:DNA-binding NarL/FixJ family response regulator